MSKKHSSMNKDQRLYMIGKVFRPSSPIQDKELFSGRIEQVRSVLNAIAQTGLHVIMYGERGVGKTSLASVIQSFLPNTEKIVSVRLNCDGDMDFKSLFRQILSEITVNFTVPGLGFGAEDTQRLETLKHQLDMEDIQPNNLRHLFQHLSAKFIIIIDEFDRIENIETKRLLSDTIKNFSDYSVDTTFILVGVANSIEQLIAEHRSIERAIVQVNLPRMSPGELDEIITKGLVSLEMSIDERVKSLIVELSQGLPHYTHLLSLYAVQNAISNDRNTIQKDDFEVAVVESIDKAQQSVKDDYHKAVNSPRGNLYKQVLLACALAKNDEMGSFAAKDVRGPLYAITGKSYQIAAFARHLSTFCSSERGSILERIGFERRYRYRFTNPIMEPFVILNGKAQKLIE